MWDEIKIIKHSGENVLQSSGVYEKLREAGVQEGDTVSIYDMEFEFVE